MDLSDGSDGEEFAANEIDENYLLGSDDEDQHHQKVCINNKILTLAGNL